MSLGNHISAVSELIKAKKHQDMSLEAMSSILAAISALLADSNKSKDYIVLSNSLNDILKNCSASTRRKNTIQESIELFEECLQLLDASMAIFKSKVLNFSLVIISGIISQLRKEKLFEIIEFVENSSLSTTMLLFQGNRIKTKQYLILSILELAHEKNPFSSEIVQKYLNYLFYKKQTKLEEIFKAWKLSYGSLNFPILYKLYEEFMKSYTKQFQVYFHNSINSSIYDPKIVFLLLETMIQLKNLAQFQIKEANCSFQCAYCDGKKQQRNFQYKIKIRTSCYGGNICKQCRKQLPKNKYLVFLPLGTGCYEREQFIHKDLKKMISLTYQLITQQNPPEFIYSIPRSSECKQISFDILRCVMWNSTLKIYPDELLYLLCIQAGSTEHKVRVKALQYLIKIVTDYPLIKNSSLLQQAVKVRLKDSNEKAKLYSIELYLLLGLQFSTLIEEIQKRDNYKLIEEIGNILIKHIASSTLQTEDLYSLCKLFANVYLPWMKLQQLAEDWLSKILKTIEGQKYTKLVIKMLLSDEIYLQSSYDTVVRLIPRFPDCLVQQIFQSVKQDRIGKWAYNPTLINVLIYNTGIFQLIIEKIKMEEEIVPSCKVLFFLLKHKQKNKLIHKGSTQLIAIKDRILSQLLVSENMENIFWLCELVCIIMKTYNQNILPVLSQYCEKVRTNQETILSCSVLIYLAFYSQAQYQYRSLAYQKLISLYREKGLEGKQHMKLFCVCWQINYQHLLELGEFSWQGMSQEINTIYQSILRIIRKIEEIRELMKIVQIFKRVHNYETNSEQFYNLLKVLIDRRLISISEGKWNKYLIKGLLISKGEKINKLASETVDKLVDAEEGGHLFSNMNQILFYLCEQAQAYDYVNYQHMRLPKDKIDSNFSMRRTFLKKAKDLLITWIQLGSLWKNVTVIQFLCRTFQNLQSLQINQYKLLVSTLQTIITRNYLSMKFSEEQIQQCMNTLIRTQIYLLQGEIYQKRMKLILRADKNIIKMQQIIIPDEYQLNKCYDMLMNGNEEDSTNSIYDRTRSQKAPGSRCLSQPQKPQKSLQSYEYCRRLRKKKLL